MNKDYPMEKEADLSFLFYIFFKRIKIFYFLCLILIVGLSLYKVYEKERYSSSALIKISGLTYLNSKGHKVFRPFIIPNEYLEIVKMKYTHYNPRIEVVKSSKSMIKVSIETFVKSDSNKRLEEIIDYFRLTNLNEVRDYKKALNDKINNALHQIELIEKNKDNDEDNKKHIRNNKKLIKNLKSNVLNSFEVLEKETAKKNLTITKMFGVFTVLLLAVFLLYMLISICLEYYNKFKMQGSDK